MNYSADELERQLENAEENLEQSVCSHLDMDRIRDNVSQLNSLIADGIEVLYF
jgi:hypothetical protein